MYQGLFRVSGYNEQFLKKNPLAILGVLRDLNKNQVPLRISWAKGQFISKILAVDPEKLIMDYGSQEYENSAVLRAGQVAIIAETQGAKVEFTLPQLVTGEYQRLPAFITPCRPHCGLSSAGSIFALARHCIRLTTASPRYRTPVRYVFACLIFPLAAWARYWNPPSPMG